MADNPYLDPTDQQVPFLPSTVGQGVNPNILQQILGGIGSGILGTTSPRQAMALGMPQASGLSPQQLQMLVNAPERQMQMQLGQAQIGNIQAQTKQRLSAANKGPSSGQMSDEAKRAIAMDLANGQIAPAQLSSILGRGSAKDRSDVFSMAKSLNPKLNMREADLSFKTDTATRTSAAKAPNSPSMFKIRALANSLVPQLDLLSQASDAVARGNIKSINSLKGKIGVEFSDKDWSNLKKRAMISADEFQAQIGAGSDQKLDLAKQLIDTADSPEVLKNAVEIMRQAVKARAIASTGAVPTGEQITGQSSGKKSKSDPLGLGL